MEASKRFMSKRLLHKGILNPIITQLAGLMRSQKEIPPFSTLKSAVDRDHGDSQWCSSCFYSPFSQPRGYYVEQQVRLLLLHVLGRPSLILTLTVPWLLGSGAKSSPTTFHPLLPRHEAKENIH